MDETAKIQEEFEKNVQWLKKAVAQEDMYYLGQQLLITAEFFLDKWMEWIDIEEEITRDPEAYGRIRALVQIYMLRKYDTDECIKEFLRRKKIK